MRARGEEQRTLLFGAYNTGDIRRVVLNDSRRGVTSQEIVYTHPEGIVSMETGIDDARISDSGESGASGDREASSQPSGREYPDAVASSARRVEPRLSGDPERSS